MTDYTLKITKEQAQILSEATEVLARLCLGQIRFALDYLPTREFRPDGWNEDADRIEEILHKYLSGHDGQRPDISRIRSASWDLYQVIRHRLSWDYAIEHGIVESADSKRNWSRMITVNFDEPMKTSDEPLAKITRITMEDEQ